MHFIDNLKYPETGNECPAGVYLRSLEATLLFKLTNWNLSYLFLLLLRCFFYWSYVCIFPARPHVVTVQWLVDCFTKGRVLPEDGYLHPDCLPPAPTALSVPAHRASTSRLSAEPPTASLSTPRYKKAEEDLLSQYMDDETTVGKCLFAMILCW